MEKDKQPTTEELNEIFATACDHHQRGLLDQAKNGYEQLLRMFPEAPVLHYNLGLVHFEQENFHRAMEVFSQGLEINPEDVDLLFNIALTRKNLGDIEGAVRGYEQVLQIEPGSVDAMYNLAGCYKDIREYQKGIEAYQKVLELDSDHSAASNNIAYLYQLVGDVEKAIFYYQKVLSVKPDHEGAGHMLAALTGEATSSAPDGYVAEVFDNYSERYEQSLVAELEYQVPAKMRKLVDEKELVRGAFSRGLDLGCGTGLGGEAFKDVIEVLDGVDLSPRMIELAGEKSIYTTLVSGNIDEFLESSVEQYEFFLAADVFAYLGDLENTFHLLARRGVQGALLCFSTESQDDVGFTLRQSGRFAHSRQYTKELAELTGWKLLCCKDANLRREKGAWVQGDLWLMQLI